MVWTSQVGQNIGQGNRINLRNYCHPQPYYSACSWAKQTKELMKTYFIKGYNFAFTYELSRHLSMWLLFQRKMDTSQTIRYMLMYFWDNIVSMMLSWQ